MPADVNPYIKAKLEERASLMAVIDSLQSGASEKQRDLTEAERQTIADHSKRAAHIDEELGQLTEVYKGAQKFQEIYGGYQEVQTQHTRQLENRRAQQAALEQQQAAALEQRQSWGTRFTTSEQFKSYGRHGSSAEFTIETTAGTLEERMTTPSGDGMGDINTGSFGGPLPSMWWSGPNLPALRTRLFDVISTVPTTMGSVQYLYTYLSQEDVASVVAEGEEKPEAPIRAEIMACPIETFAWYKGITRQALDDIPMIQNIIDTQLRRGVLRAINNAAATALTTNTDIADVDSGTSLLAQIRVAIAQIDDFGYDANAVLLNPTDWALLDTGLLPVLQRDTGAPFGPSMNTNFWSLRPVAVPQIPQGTAYVGDFAEGITYFDRQSLSLLMTDSHADYFIKNQLVLLAEARGAVKVTNASAIIKCEAEEDDDDETILVGPASAQVSSQSGGQRSGGSGQARPQTRRPPAAPQGTSPAS